MTLTDVAEEIVRAYRKMSVYVSPDNNLVFRNLYNGMCRLKGSARSFDDVLEEAKRADSSGKRSECGHTVFGRAFREIWNWYQDRYGEKEDEKESKNGINRSMKGTGNQFAELMKFRTPFRYRTFLGYLRNGSPIQNEDGYSFLLHNAVAFLLSPEETDQMLVSYGFMPLHIKNLFHIAIFIVLAGGNEPYRRGADPFSDVEKCYLEELEIIERFNDNSSSPLKGEEEAFASGSTRAIQQFVKNYYISKYSMFSFVERHREVFQRRHSRLIAEHKYLADLFSELYMRKEIDNVNDRNDEALYSLYSFLRLFCRSDKINRDTFRNELYWKTSKQLYHPTREIMILLWLFAFSFLYLPKVNEISWDGSIKNYAAVIPFNEGEVCPFKEFVSDHSFHVLRYLSNERARSAPLRGFYDGSSIANTFFFGSNLIEYLNGKLEDYAWRPLDARSPFDYMIMCLGKLNFELSGGKDEQRVLSASYGNRALESTEISAVENVPYPLVLFTELLKTVKTRMNGALPIPCKCSELM